MELLRNRKLLILSVLVIAVWGLVGYRIYNQLDEAPEPKPEHTSRMQAQTVAAANTYVLALSYPDPFLRQQLKPAATKKTASGPRIQRPVVHATPSLMINWSVLRYLGVMSNATRKKQTAIVRYNGSDFIVGIGGEIDGFKVLEIYGDSIRIGMETQTKYIKKEANQ
jgi:hypothetical protein